MTGVSPAATTAVAAARTASFVLNKGMLQWWGSGRRWTSLQRDGRRRPEHQGPSLIRTHGTARAAVGLRTRRDRARDCPAAPRVNTRVTRTSRRRARPMTNFAHELGQAAAEAGERPAVRLDDTVLTYALLDAGASRAAGLLRAHGVGPGDRVGLQLPNVPFFPIVYYGALKLGAVVVPMNPLLKDREV